MSAHTPGPWQVITDSELYDGPIVRCAKGMYVAECGHRTHPYGLANARLIAAAPALVAELELARRWLVRTGVPESELASIDAAIRAAKGDST